MDFTFNSEYLEEKRDELIKSKRILLFALYKATQEDEEDLVETIVSKLAQIMEEMKYCDKQLKNIK